MRATYIAGDVALGLRRNLTMTFAVVIISFISLLLLAFGLLLRAQVDTMKGYWYDKIEVSVFLCGADSEASTCAGSPSQPQKDAIDSDLRALPAVQDVYFESKQEAFTRFRKQFKDSAIVDNVTADQMPESFRVKLKDPERFDAVAGAFANRQGVETVQDQKQLLDKLFSVLNKLQLGAFVLAGVALLAATLLIATTIRVAAFSRRRETGIMRLVGASSLYIQLPFILEGAIAGLLGALLACGAVGLFMRYIVLGWLVPSFPFTNFVGWQQATTTMVTLVVVGVALSALASFVTLRKYLRV